MECPLDRRNKRGVYVNPKYRAQCLTGRVLLKQLVERTENMLMALFALKEDPNNKDHYPLAADFLVVAQKGIRLNRQTFEGTHARGKLGET